MKVVPLLVVGLALFGCKEGNQDKKDTLPLQQETAQPLAMKPSPTKGQALMENQCYVCHSATASEADRIGPPMAAIKARYLMDHPQKADFVAALWQFVEQPSQEKAKMRGAVKRFGVMPYQAFPKEEITAIAEFMFDHKIAEPTWFKAHWEERHGPYQQQGKDLQAERPVTQSNKERGMAYAMETKQELGKNLMGTLQKKGTLAALEFCNVKAYPLTDSMATVHQANIKRVTDKPRNPNNQANATALAHLARFKEWVAQGDSYEPILEEYGDQVHFYYPIITNTKCLQCHGSPATDIQENVLSKIKALYPNDKATGYHANEVRGIWSITFPKQGL
jgi:cytochrome c551/c552